MLIRYRAELTVKTWNIVLRLAEFRLDVENLEGLMISSEDTIRETYDL